MDGEVERFIKVWLTTISCLSYCYYIASRIPKGFMRLLSLLPILYLFLSLPFNLSSFHLGGPTTFFLVWLDNFKLILFSFNQGPLALSPPNILHFISIASLPINPKQHSPTKNNHTNNTQKPKWLLLLKVLIFAMIIRAYDYREKLHPHFILVLYCYHMYLGIELLLALSAIPIRTLLGFEIEPQFNEPCLFTSLQDFGVLGGISWLPFFYSPLPHTCYSHVGSHVLFCASRCVHRGGDDDKEGDAPPWVTAASRCVRTARGGVLGSHRKVPHTS
uniref:Wax synthase domain-containing protein n=1 Tax=Glycine max TaxID=3847 RepID=A0A0R0F9H0_SOYBN